MESRAKLFGHPIHQQLIVFPLGLLFTSVVFDVIYVLTGNNPATTTMSVYARQQLVDFQDVGYGSAAATSLFLIVALATAIVITVGRVNVSGAGERR